MPLLILHDLGSTLEGPSWILAAWMLQILVLSGLGLLLRRVITKTPPRASDLAGAVWLGFALTIIFLQIWHIWMPIDWRASLVLAPLGLLGLAIHWRAALTGMGSLRGARTLLSALVVALIVLWFVDRALAAPSTYDNGMYHIPVIHWASTYPVVKGLGNLDGHFAFNNASLLYEAALETGFWRGRSAHIANGPLLLVTALYFLYLAGRLKPAGKNIALAAYPLVLLTPVTFLLLDPLFTISNPTPDLIASALLFFISWLLLEQIEWQRFSQFEQPDRGFRIVTLLVLCAVAPCIKLSTAFYAGTAAIIGGLFWLRSEHGPIVARRRVAALALGLSVVAIGTWCIRSILLSGYPFFPSAALGLPVDWRIPSQHAEWYAWWIKTYARVPYREAISADGFAWVPSWFSGEFRSAKISGILPLAITAVSGLIVFLRRRKPAGFERRQIVLWLPPAVGLAAWFLSAPSFRFGFALFWILAAQTATWALASLEGKTSSLVLAGLCILPLLPILQIVQLRAREGGEPVARAIQDTLFEAPGPDYGLQPYYQSALDVRLTSQGLRANVPKNYCLPGDSTPARDCVVWNAPLPATCFLLDTLALRRPGELGSGFMVRDSPDSWIDENWRKVQTIQKEHNWNLRQTAFYFRVHPRYVAAALDRRETAR